MFAILVAARVVVDHVSKQYFLSVKWYDHETASVACAWLRLPVLMCMFGKRMMHVRELFACHAAQFSMLHNLCRCLLYFLSLESQTIIFQWWAQNVAYHGFPEAWELSFIGFCLFFFSITNCTRGLHLSERRGNICSRFHRVFTKDVMIGSHWKVLPFVQFRHREYFCCLLYFCCVCWR